MTDEELRAIRYRLPSIPPYCTISTLFADAWALLEEVLRLRAVVESLQPLAKENFPQ